jgi:hypothetical protein
LLQSPQAKRFFFQAPTPVAGTPTVPQKVTLAPGQACSIPLLNAAPKGGFTGDPKMVVPRTQQLRNVDHMPVLQPPAPSCADVKR